MRIGKTIMLASDHNDTSSAGLDDNGSSPRTRLPSPQRGRGAGGEGGSGGGNQFQRSLSDRDLGMPSVENANGVFRPLTPNPSPALGRGGPKFLGSLRRFQLHLSSHSLRLGVSAVALCIAADGSRAGRAAKDLR